MPAAVTIAESKAKDFERKDGELTRNLVQAVIDDPDKFEDVPNDVMLVLIPDDDPDYMASCIERGIEDFQRGFNVYFRHYPTKRTPPRDEVDPPNGE